jgi:hypothetical protein
MQDAIDDGRPGGTPDAPPSSGRPPAGYPPTTARDKLQAAAGDPAQTARSLAGEAKQTLAGKLDGRKNAAADMVEQFAQSVGRSGEQFQGRQDWIAGAVGRGAQELNAFASSIRDKDVGELVDEVQSFATRKPAVFMAAAFAAGFAIARVGKLIAGDLSRDDLPTIPEVGHGGH